MKVHKTPNGFWGIYDGEQLVEAFATQGQAWRALDRQGDEEDERRRRIQTAFTDKHYSQ